jgi:hypothetical protein
MHNHGLSSNSTLQKIVVVIALIPLIFINLNNKHDWGDDFAQYLLQAQHIIGQQSQIPVLCVNDYGPAVKGPLFSVALTPVFLFSGNEITAGKVLVSIGWIVCCLCLFIFMKSLVGFFSSLLATLFVGYHFILVVAINQILPDSLFMALLVYGLYKSYNIENSDYSILTFISVGLILLKPIGIIFPVALFLASFTIKNILRIQWQYTLITLFALIISSAVPLLWWESAGSAFDLAWYYQKIIGSFHPVETANRLLLYWNTLFLYFDNDVPAWINLFGKVITGILFITGLIAGLAYRKNFAWVLLLYIATLILFPYNNNPVRLLMVIFPLIIIAVIYSCIQIAEYLSIKRGLIIVPLFLFYTVANLPNAIYNVKHSEKNSGPFDNEAVAMFDALQKNVTKGEVIACEKPWAVAYYSGLTTTPIPLKDRSTGLATKCDAVWLLASKPETLSGFRFKGTINRVYSNNKYNLYRLGDDENTR